MVIKDKRLTWYFVLSFGLAWILQITVSVLKIQNIGGDGVFVALLSLCMFMPLVATIVSAKITGERVGIKIKPNIKGNVRWYAAAWFSPVVLCSLGAALYFLICSENFDPEMTTLNDSLKQMAEAGQNVENLTPALMLAITVLQALTFAPIINGIAAFGEEAGWRGYMTPELVERFGRTKGLIFSGVIWGVWHWPVIALVGYNFGTGYPLYPIPGLLAMCLACTALGIVFSFLYEKTDSIWAPSIAHGAVNAIANIGAAFLLPSVTSTVLGPALGFISIIPFAVVAMGIMCREYKIIDNNIK